MICYISMGVKVYFCHIFLEDVCGDVNVFALTSTRTKGRSERHQPRQQNVFQEKVCNFVMSSNMSPLRCDLHGDVHKHSITFVETLLLTISTKVRCGVINADYLMRCATTFDRMSSHTLFDMNIKHLELCVWHMKLHLP